MGNQLLCGGGQLRCTDSCGKPVGEDDHREPVLNEKHRCSPAGTVFAEDLDDLNDIDRHLLLFSTGTNVAAVRWLLQLGANFESRDNNGTTCLHAACRSGAVATVETFLAQRAQSDDRGCGDVLNSVDVAGWTPLHTAAFMGRRDIVGILLREGARDVPNLQGQTPVDLCNDSRTKQLLLANRSGLGGVWKGRSDLSRTEGAGPLAVDEALPHASRYTSEASFSPLGSEVRFEPFFVPRTAVVKDLGTRSIAFRKEIAMIGRGIFDRQPGRGLAFLVATGAVRDYPMDVVAFLQASGVDPTQVGLFLGEDFSLSKILRMEFINAIGFTNCGIVASLRKALAYFRMPTDLQKMDRILQSLAEVWWRQHSRQFGYGGGADDRKSWRVNSPRKMGESGKLASPSGDAEDDQLEEEGEGFQVSVFKTVPTPELDGVEVRRVVKSAGIVHQLMFSTHMLEWNLKSSLPRSHKIALQTWLAMNKDIGKPICELPRRLLEPIYNSIATGDLPEYPDRNEADHSEPDDFLSDFSKISSWGTVLGEGLPTLLDSIGGKNSNAPAVDCLHMSNLLAESTSTSRRRPSERHLYANSENLSRPIDVVAGATLERELRPQDMPRGRDAVWLSLCGPLLFLSTGPGGSRTPFAFVYIQGGSVRAIHSKGDAPTENSPREVPEIGCDPVSAAKWSPKGWTTGRSTGKDTTNKNARRANNDEGDTNVGNCSVTPSPAPSPTTDGSPTSSGGFVLLSQAATAPAPTPPADGGFGSLETTPAPPSIPLVLLFPDGRWQQFNLPKLAVEIDEPVELASWLLHLNETLGGATAMSVSGPPVAV